MTEVTCFLKCAKVPNRHFSKDLQMDNHHVKRCLISTENYGEGLPWWSSGLDSMLLLQGARCDPWPQGEILHTTRHSEKKQIKTKNCSEIPLHAHLDGFYKKINDNCW